MQDTYKTLEAEASATLKVEGSRFLAEAAPVPNRSVAERRIEQTRKREHKATHHCFAYRLGVSGDEVRYDDDGEPSGTAGPPILRQIEALDLTNTLVVVTRYYGGTKLGTGGLARAYGDAADAALQTATIVDRVVRTSVRLRFDYDDTSPARRVLEQFDAVIEESYYTDVTEWTVGVRASEVDSFLQAFTDQLSDRGTVLGVGEEVEGDDEV